MSQKTTKYNKIFRIFDNKGLNLEKIYLFLIIFIILVSLFVNIPSDQTTIGISASILDIGDRNFYINETGKGFGYEEYSGNILYPLILKNISFITSLFGKDQYSKLWNLIIILITSSFSIISLKLLKISASNLFNKKVSNIASILYMINPYTYFYSLSGGITNFLIVGVTCILYLFSKRLKKDGYVDKNNIREAFYIILISIYLSFLRPSGGIFGFLILIFLLFECLKKTISNQAIEFEDKIKTIFVFIGITVVTYNIFSTLGYSLDHIRIFSNEGGQFFGYSRDLLRDQLTYQTNNIFINIKNSSYFLVWKLTDFVSGLSDIRDTHSQFLNEGIILPFIFRTFTGIFIIFPINLFSFLGIIVNLKFILKSQIWIVLFSAFLAVCPSLIGVSMSRYLMMFYPPFIVFSAKMIHDTFLGIRQNKN